MCVVDVKGSVQDMPSWSDLAPVMSDVKFTEKQALTRKILNYRNELPVQVSKE